jgi:hypothetical protein
VIFVFLLNSHRNRSPPQVQSPTALPRHTPFSAHWIAALRPLEAAGDACGAGEPTNELGDAL